LGCVMDPFGSGLRPVEISYEYDNESLGLIKGGKCLYWVTDN
jgi:hypothetical protein